MAPYEALYGRKCRSPLHWDDLGKRQFIGPKLLQQTTEVVGRIRQRVRIAQSRQKSYADCRRRDLEFNVGDHVFLKIKPVRGSTRFRKKGKLQPRYIGPFEILDRIVHVAYKLALPPLLSSVHNVFHVSMLRRYIFDPSHILQKVSTQLHDDLTYDEERPVQILERSIKKLRRKEIPLVKILWQNQATEEVTWELKDEIKRKCSHLFGKLLNFENKIFIRRGRCDDLKYMIILINNTTSYTLKYNRTCKMIGSKHIYIYIHINLYRDRERYMGIGDINIYMEQKQINNK